MDLELKRSKLMDTLDDNSIVVLFSGSSKFGVGDERLPFSVDRNFYYFTNLDRENMVFIGYKINNEASYVLAIEAYDEMMAKWVGGRMLAREVSSICEISDIENYDSLNTYLDLELDRYRKDGAKVYFDFFKREDNNPTIATKLANALKNNNPWLETKDIFPYIANLRLVKDEYELTCLKQAINITRSGIEAMMKAIKPGINEMVMEGIFNFALAKNMCNETSFKTICAAGKRATVLHYSDNNQVCEEGDMLLTDLGATYRHYCGDITRTYPVNGKFTPRQKELYNVVLNAQKLVQENAKPGVKLKDLNNLVIKYYEMELPKHGLKKPVSEYYYHGVSHHIGLDVHDLDGGVGQTLQAGNVISNEPGLYVEDENIGIRIEDDLLITGTGCVNLSEKIIKEVDDVEKLMRA